MTQLMLNIAQTLRVGVYVDNDKVYTMDNQPFNAMEALEKAIKKNEDQEAALNKKSQEMIKYLEALIREQLKKDLPLGTPVVIDSKLYNIEHYFINEVTFIGPTGKRVFNYRNLPKIFPLREYKL